MSAVDAGQTHNDGPDCCEGTHYEPEGTLNDAFTRLSEGGFAKDWGSAEDTVYDHTTAEEREGMLKMVNATPPANQLEARYGLWIDRLCADVKRLEAEAERLRKQGCPNCVHCILKL